MEQSSQLKYEVLRNIMSLHKGYWFSPDTMRFFKSKVYENVVYVGDLYFFISSEKQGTEPRRYTVRTMDKNGKIESFSEFQQFSTKKQAERFIEKHTGANNFTA